MTVRSTIPSAIFLALWVAAYAGLADPPARPTAAPAGPRPPAGDVAAPAGFPEVGKWMYSLEGVPAHWLGEQVRGKTLREPINVLIVDPYAATVEDAKARVLAACERAGYPARFGHSGGYRAFIAGMFHRQLPEEKEHAFSNFPFEVDNNHGRLFGPAPGGGDGAGPYYFAGAFSRENVDPVTKVKHRYASFDRARDDFARRMDEHTDYKLTAFVHLGNELLGDPRATTGDHDGVAVLLTAVR